MRRERLVVGVLELRRVEEGLRANPIRYEMLGYESGIERGGSAWGCARIS